MLLVAHFTRQPSAGDGKASRAISDAVPLDTEVLEQRQVEVRQRCFLRITNMTSAFQRAGAAACKQQRDVPRIVSVALTHAGSIYQRGMVQQLAVAVGSRSHLVQQISKLRHVIGVDLFHLRDFFGLAGVVRNWVVRVGDVTDRLADNKNMKTYNND